MSYPVTLYRVIWWEHSDLKPQLRKEIFKRTAQSYCRPGDRLTFKQAEYQGYRETPREAWEAFATRKRVEVEKLRETLTATVDAVNYAETMLAKGVE